ncbi:unnamed protein product [Protopolystoma xenopodis]|uniref:Uncharacterized protein n=1 Tax=Protopolystoma xenopodis TaxID=117903 RepID=A0A448XLM8_9PLAT|nr:unnamed protein product [Protopolystoma xenopodis]
MEGLGDYELIGLNNDLLGQSRVPGDESGFRMELEEEDMKGDEEASTLSVDGDAGLDKEWEMGTQGGDISGMPRDVSRFVKDAGRIAVTLQASQSSRQHPLVLPESGEPSFWSGRRRQPLSQH